MSTSIQCRQSSDQVSGDDDDSVSAEQRSVMSEAGKKNESKTDWRSIVQTLYRVRFVRGRKVSVTDDLGGNVNALTDHSATLCRSIRANVYGRSETLGVTGNTRG